MCGDEVLGEGIQGNISPLGLSFALPTAEALGSVGCGDIENKY